MKVLELMDACFIAMLKVALMGVFTATLVAPFAGIVDTTAGTVTVSWPHPATNMTNRAASQYVITTLYLRICSLLSNMDVAERIHVNPSAHVNLPAERALANLVSRR